MFEKLFDRNGLSVERLHALVRLADEGSLIRAASGDVGVQSRYSHAIKELSAYFGVALTERRGKSIRLTEHGEQLVRLARDHFEKLLDFKESAEGLPPKFKIGAEESILQLIVVPTLSAARRANAIARFSLHNLSQAETISRLIDQRLDFGLLSKAPAQAGIEAITIGTTRYIVVVPDQIGTRRGALTLEDALLSCPHAAASSHLGQMEFVRELAKSLGGCYEPELECDSISQCSVAVSTGKYAAVLPHWAWKGVQSAPYSICEDVALDAMTESLCLVWNPASVESRGAKSRDVVLMLEKQMKMHFSDESA
jgi:DNA-binding transcriptional LysR family regulator